ncbi:MAG: preprotein translocase subunit SecY [Endomicrobium sp.]|jgi:preprotein translocase subunit SecY|nr:preprotein translocase subunit SecY [Endomicrobium sp.]
MLKDFLGVFKLNELKKRLFFTILLIVVYRIGVTIPIPGVNIEAVRSLFSAQSNGFFNFLDIFSGGAINRMSIFSVGIIPYINASIIMSLIQSAHIFPYFDKFAENGETGRKKITQITRYGALILGAVQSFALAIAMTKMPAAFSSVVLDPSWQWIILTVFTLLAGSILIMWLGEQVTERGIGNGISLIIFAGIVEKLPRAILKVAKLLQSKEIQILYVLTFLAVIIIVLISVIWIETAQRKIPIHYAKRVVGRKMYNSQMSFLPVKVDQSGVISVIFSVSILSVPLTIAQFAPKFTILGFPVAKKITEVFNSGSLIYSIMCASLIIFFCYFYNSISFNPKDLAENIKKFGGFIPGVRPGNSTSLYIQRVLERVTLCGALFVASIAILPDCLRTAMNIPFFLGGTSLLIAVGVSLDTIGQMESYIIMHQYEGFMKKGYVKRKWFHNKIDS